jgi:phosphopantetheinyl transferase
MSLFDGRAILVSIAEIAADTERWTSALGPQERRIHERFTVDKRRADWLAGRIAAKRAVQRAHGLPFSRIEILAQAAGPTRGRPEALIDGRLAPGHLSISHSGDLAAAAYEPGPIGIDLEQVSPRDRAFLELAFDDQERAAFSLVPEGFERDAAITGAWCMKEALSKWIGAGLRVPFHRLTVPRQARARSGRIDGMAWAWVSGPAPSPAAFGARP